MIEAHAPLPGEIEHVCAFAKERWVRDAVAGGGLGALFARPRTTVLLIEGVPVAAGGFIDHGNGGAIGWTLIGDVQQRHVFGLVRKFRDLIIATPFDIIEAHCFLSFPESHRWVTCIGFKRVPGEYLTPDGRPFLRFAFRNHHGN